VLKLFLAVQSHALHQVALAHLQFGIDHGRRQHQSRLLKQGIDNGLFSQ
jgi:hypothetical protein